MRNINEIGIKVEKYITSLKEDLSNLNKERLGEFFLKRRFLLISIFTIALFGIFSFNFFMTSKNELINDLEVSLKEGKVYRISRKIRVLEERPSKKELTPLINYYNYDLTKIDGVIKDLRNTNKGGVFTLKKNNFLFLENYYLEITPVSIKVNTDFDSTKIYLNDNLLKDSNIKKGVIPGIYKVKGELETPYGKVSKEEEVSLMQNEEISLKLDAMNITLSSNFDDAKVYINDKDTGKVVRDIKDFGPIPTNLDTYISLEKNFPWGVIKSDKLKVTDLPNINIKINMVNDTLKKNIEEVVKRFYESVFLALNSRDKSLIVLTNDDIKERIYENIEKKTLILKNNYEISELKTNIESSEFKYQDDAYKAKIVVKVEYDVSKKFIPVYTKKHEDMFLTTMKYIGNEWIIEGVQKFNLE